MDGISRRSLLRGGIAGASLAAFSQWVGETRAQGEVAPGDSIQTILDLAATSEVLSCTHYYTALTNNEIQFSSEERRQLLASLDAELGHAHYLIVQLGAQPLKRSYYLPENIYTNRTNFADVTRQLKTAFASAYLAAVRRLAEIRAPLLAASFAQLAMTEGVHLALIRQIEGLLPNDKLFGEPLYYNLSEIAPVLRPFLEGSTGFAGPVDYPGDNTILTLVGDNRVQVIDSFSKKYGSRLHRKD
jgi:hypothetical protein